MIHQFQSSESSHRACAEFFSENPGAMKLNTGDLQDYPSMPKSWTPTPESRTLLWWKENLPWNVSPLSCDLTFLVSQWALKQQKREKWTLTSFFLQLARTVLLFFIFSSPPFKWLIRQVGPQLLQRAGCADKALHRLFQVTQQQATSLWKHRNRMEEFRGWNAGIFALQTLATVSAVVS